MLWGKRKYITVLMLLSLVDILSRFISSHHILVEYMMLQVPGAWLESRVKKVRNGRYCVGRVLSTGSLWVERDRLRLVKHVINIEGENMSPAMTDPRVQLTTHASVVSMDNGRRGILDRFRRRSNITGGCCTM